MDIGYKIIFNDEASRSFKDKVLLMMIKLYNEGCSNLGVVAELTGSICLRDEEEKTAKFIDVGF